MYPVTLNQAMINILNQKMYQCYDDLKNDRDILSEDVPKYHDGIKWFLEWLPTHLTEVKND